VHNLSISVVLALPGEAYTVDLRLPAGSTIRDAIAQSGMDRLFPDIVIDSLACGVWGKRVNPATLVTEGDRVELYRPLRVDPKNRRRQAARRRGGHAGVMENA